MAANVPAEILMDADEMGDAALAGLDNGETVTIPLPPDMADWKADETERRNMAPRLSLSSPAARHGVSAYSRKLRFPPQVLWTRLCGPPGLEFAVAGKKLASIGEEASENQCRAS